MKIPDWMVFFLGGVGGDNEYLSNCFLNLLVICSKPHITNSTVNLLGGGGIISVF